MYRSVEHVITAYLKKYTLQRAIQRAQQERASQGTEDGFEFWDSAVNALVAMKPKKTFKKKEE